MIATVVAALAAGLVGMPWSVWSVTANRCANLSHKGTQGASVTGQGTRTMRLSEPKGLLIGGIAAGLAGVMVDLLSPIYASLHEGFGLSNTAAGFLVTAALGAMGVVELGLAPRSVSETSGARRPMAWSSLRWRSSTSVR